MEKKKRMNELCKYFPFPPPLEKLSLRKTVNTNFFLPSRHIYPFLLFFPFPLYCSPFPSSSYRSFSLSLYKSPFPAQIPKTPLNSACPRLREREHWRRRKGEPRRWELVCGGFFSLRKIPPSGEGGGGGNRREKEKIKRDLLKNPNLQSVSFINPPQRRAQEKPQKNWKSQDCGLP